MDYIFAVMWLSNGKISMRYFKTKEHAEKFCKKVEQIRELVDINLEPMIKQIKLEEDV